MPCDTITRQSVALANAVPAIVVEALKALEWNIVTSTETQISASLGGSSLTWTAGKGLAVRGRLAQQQIRAMTKMYSVRAVHWAAQRAGWTVQQTAADKLTVSRR